MTRAAEPAKKSPEEIADYLIEVGSTLASCGCPSYRLEDTVRLIAELEGVEAAPFAMPTGFFVEVRTREGARVVRLARVEESGMDLGRLVAVDHIFNDVAERVLTIDEGRARLRELGAARPPYPTPLRWAAIAASSGAVAVFFGGGVVEAVAATATGLAIFAFARFVSRNPSGRFLVDFFGGAVAACAAAIAARVRPTIAYEVVVLSGVIALIPGMKFTTGLAELAKKSLVAGGARLMDTLVTFVSIVFGIAFALSVQKLLHLSPPAAAPREGLGLLGHAVALVISSFAFGVIFAVPRAYLWGALVSGATGYVATALSMRFLPAHVAAFVAALSVCTLGNGLARATHRPAQLFQVPGMMVLVPGSVGFLSLGDFLQGEFLSGAAKGFQMTLIGGGLVMGVLLANLILPARKML